MSKKDLIKTELEKLDEQGLGELYEFAKRLADKQSQVPEQPGPTQPESIMTKLRKIKIQGPPDFSENLDLYTSGAKSFDDVH